MRARGERLDETRTWDDRGRSRWESKLVLLSGAASCPAKRESRCLDNTVSEVPLSRG